MHDDLEEIKQLFAIREYWNNRARDASIAVNIVELAIVHGSKDSLRAILEDNLGIPEEQQLGK